MSDTTDTRPDLGGVSPRPPQNPWYRARRDTAPPDPDDPHGTGTTNHLDPDVSPMHHASDVWISGGAGSGESRNSGLRIAIAVLVVGASAYFFGPYAFLIIGALLVSIILHEFGHYATARACGMKATEFFVGFGPRIWSFRRGETEYGLKAIPAGAYVKIIGMNNLEDVDPADEPRTYRAQSSPKRMAVVLAGPAMNLLIAFVLLFSIILIHGQAGDQWTVGRVQPGTAAEAAGVKVGDKVLTVGGEQVSTWEHFRDQLNQRAGTTVPIVVLRDGQQVTLNADLGWRLTDAVAKTIPSTPALGIGDVIGAADGQELRDYDDLRTLLAQDGPPVKLSIERADHDYELIVNRPLQLPASDAATGYLGVANKPVFVTETPVGAAGETLAAFKETLVRTGAVFGGLFTPEGLQNYAGQVAESTQTPTTLSTATEKGVLTPINGSPSPDAAASGAGTERPISIVGIVRLGSDAAQVDLWLFLGLVASINFALAIINLLPLLPFDGGHAVIAGYEGIRGSIRRRPYRADITKMLPVVYGVFAVLVLLGSTSILLDFLRPPTLP